MRKNKLKIISYFSFFVALIIFKPLLAQRFTDSPYSRFGIGQIQQKSFAQANALGGSHIALKNDTLLPLFINVANPASYTSLLLTTFEAGVNSTFNKFSNSTTTFNSNNTSLNYIILRFRIPGKKIKEDKIIFYNQPDFVEKWYHKIRTIGLRGPCCI